MNTKTLLYENNFFHFDEKNIGARTVNPRNQTLFDVNLMTQPSSSAQKLVSKYDLEISPASDPADVFCNIKTTMTWEFEINKPTDLGSSQFSEAVLHHVLNQVHFASMVLRQNFVMDFVTIADLLHKPNVKDIHTQLKQQFDFLVDLNLRDDYPFLFSYWY